MEHICKHDRYDINCPACVEKHIKWQDDEIAQLRRELDEAKETIDCSEKRTEYLVAAERKRADELQKELDKTLKCQQWYVQSLDTSNQRADLNERAVKMLCEEYGQDYDDMIRLAKELK